MDNVPLSLQILADGETKERVGTVLVTIQPLIIVEAKEEELLLFFNQHLYSRTDV